MCGIAGWFDPEAPADERLVAAMVARLHHRGPDDGGLHVEQGLALGMRRLAIIDIAGGQQPMWSSDRRYVIVYNGQVYNYIELREELRAKGAVFHTNCDTEVVIEAIRAYGRAALVRLNGMFAFALWDTQERTLLIARDRMGVKPLYWCQDGRRIAFASELKSLLLVPWLDRVLDREAASEYLMLGYVRAPRTLMRHVRKLEPAHIILIQKNSLETFEYWRPDFTPAPLTTLDESAERVRELLRESVRIRLRSDVPVGAFLSGGLDSSAVTALMATQSDTPVNTYSVGFEDGGVDELPYARAVAERYGTRHHEIKVSVLDALDHLPDLVWHLDEPSADTAQLPSYLISQFAARELKVVLTGAGSDELFGGYTKYFEGRPIEHTYRRVPHRIRRSVTTPLIAAIDETYGWRAQANDLSPDDRLAWNSAFFSADSLAMVSASAPPVHPFASAYAAAARADHANRLMGVDLVTYLPDDILHMTDRMSMAVSLEVREPFLDAHLVQYALGLPSCLKLNQRSRAWKIVLKEAMKPLLPESILTRTKQGFGGPAKAWMQNGLEGSLRRLMLNSRAAQEGLIDLAGVRAYLNRGASYDRIHRGLRLWNLLILEVWARVYVEGRGEKPSVGLDDLAS
jgi:asparagine synthase (glutamine-hydrolysing)